MLKVLTNGARITALLLAVVLIGAQTVLAQDVAVTVQNVTGHPGETVTVDVMLADVETASGAIQSYGFTVVDTPDITFLGIADQIPTGPGQGSTDGSLAGDAGFTSSFSTGTDNVGGFSTGTDIATSGLLVRLNFVMNTVGNGVITLTNFQLNGGNPAANPLVPTGTYQVANRIINIADLTERKDQDNYFSINLEDAISAPENVISFNLDVLFNPTLVQIDQTRGVNGVMAGALTDGWALNGASLGPGAFRIAGNFTGNPIIGLGELVRVAVTTQSVLGTDVLQITNVVFNAGAPVYATKEGRLTIIPNTAPVADNGTLTVDEDTPGDVTLTGSDFDGDPITFSVTSGPSNGSISQVGDVITYTPSPDYNGPDSFIFIANDGLDNSAPATMSITVNPINDPPVIVSSPPNATILGDDSFTGTFVATDVDTGDILTYSFVSAPDGATINGSTGVVDWSPSTDQVGDFDFNVQVTDQTATVNFTTLTVTVVQVDQLEARVLGLHEVPPALSVASGVVNARLVADDSKLDVWGSFMNLSGPVTIAHIHMGDVHESGAVALPLDLSTFVESSDRDGEFEIVSNMYDLDALSYPAGVTKATFVEALRNGGTYVNIHTAAYPAGEIRGTLLHAPNSPPEGTTVRGPGSATISGDPNDVLFSVSWLPASDPDGNNVRYIYQMSSAPSFAETVNFEQFGQVTGFQVTVADAAGIFDNLSGGTPGNIDIGGSLTVYHRVISTDGSAWTAGDSKSLTITRGIVTDTEGGTELPAEFTLEGNYPNPFNPSTTIRFDLPEAANVSITVHDLLGRQVLVVPVQAVEAGASRSLQLDASSLASGIYLYRVIARMGTTTGVKVGNMTLIK